MRGLKEAEVIDVLSNGTRATRYGDLDRLLREHAATAIARHCMRSFVRAEAQLTLLKTDPLAAARASRDDMLASLHGLRDFDPDGPGGRSIRSRPTIWSFER